MVDTDQPKIVQTQHELTDADTSDYVAFGTNNVEGCGCPVVQANKDPRMMRVATNSFDTNVFVRFDIENYGLIRKDVAEALWEEIIDHFKSEKDKMSEDYGGPEIGPLRDVQAEVFSDD
jgi:hypothetical protein